MNFELFKERTCETLKKRFPDAKVEISQVGAKSLHPYTGLSFLRAGKTSCFVINLDWFYKRYCNNEDYDKLVSEMIEQSDDERIGTSLDKYMYYEEAKSVLFAQLRYIDAVPEDAVYYEIDDFAMMFFLLVGKFPGGNWCLRISKELLEIFNVSEEQLMKDALKNSEVLMPPCVTPLAELLQGDMGCGKACPMTTLVVTNIENCRGAVVLFYEGMLDRLASYLQDDLLIVPSSIHEMLVFPASEHVGEEEKMEELIHEMNMTSLVGRGEKLSDHLFCYHRFTRSFVPVFEKKERLRS